MSYRGDIRLGDTIDVKFTTRQISGAPFTLGGTPVISAYVGNGTTVITAGITLTVDFDARTGLNNVRVVASSGNGFATATNVQLVITTGTVNSVSVVGEVVAEFSIENRRSDVQFWNGTQVATPATAGIPDVNVKNMNNVAATPITTIKAVQGLAVDGVITTLTNLPAITANWLTAAGIAAGALDGKGNWNIGKTGYTLTAGTGLGNQTADITGSLSGSVGSVTAAVTLTSGERNSVADALLGRNVGGGSSTGRLVSEALYVLRNKTAISAGTLTVYGTDDTTPAFTATVATTAGDPISSIDPA